MIKLNGKKNIAIIITFIMILLATAPILTVLAETEEDANIKLNKEIDKYLEGSSTATDVIYKIQQDAKYDYEPEKNTIMHIMKRVFAIGEYLNDVEYGVLSNKLDLDRSDVLYNDRYLCNPDAPYNLISHNCNIPNFTTDLLQTFFSSLSTPFNNAEKTASFATAGFGVPKDIPGKIVPADPERRSHTYTALELYGYNLQRISYNGEWDKIDVSSEARMLSNFGVIDKVTLLGTGLWNSVKSGLGALIENFSFNPLRWGKVLAKSVESFLTGGINVVIDTSDLNIVATNRWKRSGINGTLYNVYVMTDKEVLNETNKKYFQLFVDKLTKKADASPELLKVMELQSIPLFTYDPEWETDESIAARENAIKELENQENSTETDDESTDASSKEDIIIPEPIYYTEKEQFKFWSNDNHKLLKKGKKQGLFSGNLDDYEDYDALASQWTQAWKSYFSREFNALGPVIQDLIDESDLEIFTKNPHLDPKQGISHYACANPDGTIMKTGDSIEYLYLNNNKGSEQYVNPRCAPARPPIGSGLLGNGWHDKTISDTRHISNVLGEELSKNTMKSLMSASDASKQTSTGFVAQITNTVIGLAFSPLLNELGLSEMISELISGFRDTLFFPMASIVIAIGSIILFLKLLKNASAWQLIMVIFITFIIYISGAIFMFQPEAILNIIDKGPSKVDNFLANVILVDDDGSDYCSTGVNLDGVRSAQCNVWGAMVFNPWVHSQFGTKYENLFAKGYAPEGGYEFKNQNEHLVGNAEVNMGNGYLLHNWAIYQLDKTKAGTINDLPLSSLTKIGTVDKDLYRMVDLQAGPNYGLYSDSTYFNVWSGQENSDSLGILFSINTLLMAFTLITVSFLKIEASFVFALTMLFLPIILLYGLLPQGRMKLKEYFSNLLSLLLKRTIITIMLSILLKIYTVSYSIVDTVEAASLIAIGVSVAFLLYKKELLNLLVGENSSTIKNVLSDSIPQKWKYSYQRSKASLSAKIGGFTGGVMGAVNSKVSNNLELSKQKKKLNKFTNLSKTKKLTSKEQIQVSEIKDKITEAQTYKNFLSKKEQSIFNLGLTGASQSDDIIGRKTERAIRKQGYTAMDVYKQSKDTVKEIGVDEITQENPNLSDTYKKLLSTSKNNESKTVKHQLTSEEKRLLEKAAIQKKIRKQAKKTDNLATKNIANKNHNALSSNDELEKIAKYLDKNKKKNKIKGYVINPQKEFEIQKESKLNKPDSSNVLDHMPSELKDLLKNELEETKKAEEEKMKNNKKTNKKKESEENNV